MRKSARDVAEGLEAVFGPVAVPRWLHHGFWAIAWTIWILAAIGWVYERL